MSPRPRSRRTASQDVGRYPVGTGPFVFEKAEKGNQAVLTAFDDYWGGRPYLDRVVIRVIPEDRTMTAASCRARWT